MFPDEDILEQRLQQVRCIPWCIPAVVLLAFTDEDLDDLAAASDVGDRNGWWRILNRVVTRCEAKNGAGESHRRESGPPSPF